MRRPWSVLVLVVAAGCAPKPPDTATDELLFALPSWCGKQGPRRPWTSWAVERGQPDGGTGVCGVRLPDAPGEDRAGVCLELVDHRVARAEVRSSKARAAFDPAAVGATWVTVPEGEPVLVQVSGGVVRARSVDGQTTQGPCFLR